MPLDEWRPQMLFSLAPGGRGTRLSTLARTLHPLTKNRLCSRTKLEPFSEAFLHNVTIFLSPLSNQITICFSFPFSIYPPRRSNHSASTFFTPSFLSSPSGTSRHRGDVALQTRRDVTMCHECPRWRRGGRGLKT